MTVRRYLVGAMLAASLVLAVSAAPALADPQQPEIGATTYQLDPGKRVVHVTIVLTEKNAIPSEVSTYSCPRTEYDPWYGFYTVQVTCTNTTNYYVDKTGVWIEKEARNIRATATGGSASVSTKKTDGDFKLIAVTYPRIFQGQTRKVTVTYDLPGGKPRSEAWTRAGAAYARFCGTPNGHDGGTVRFVLPAGFTAEHWGDKLSDASTSSAFVLQSANIDDVTKAWSCIEAVNPDGFRRTRIDVAGGQGVLLEAWPEDESWASHVAGDVKSALPALESLIGYAPPGTGDITVQEAAAAQVGEGYGGDYLKDERVARISEDYERGTVVHELAHAWFNPTTFAPNWLSEGYASYAENRLTQATPCTDPLAYPGGGTPDLSKWTYIGPKSTGTEKDIVTYNYDAACAIVTGVIRRMDDEHVRAVFAALRDGGDVYTGAPGSSSVPAVDWKRWLDVVDEVGLASTGPAPDLDYAQRQLVEYGIATEGALSGRASARAAYHKVKEAAGAWSLPPAISAPMSAWSFLTAEDAMAAAETVLAKRAQLSAAASTAVVPAVELEKAFEDARTTSDLVAAADLADTQIAAAAAVDDARRAVDAPRDVSQSVGLLGAVDPKVAADDAAAAFAAGRYADAQQLSADAQAEVTASGPTGSTRLVVAAVAAVGVVLLLVVLAFAWRRSRRRQPVLAAASIAPVMDPAAVGPVAQDAAVDAAAPVPTDAAAPEVSANPAAQSAPAPPSQLPSNDPASPSDWSI